MRLLERPDPAGPVAPPESLHLSPVTEPSSAWATPERTVARAAVPAVAATAGAGSAVGAAWEIWRAAWTRRHTVTLLTLTPLAALGYGAVADPQLSAGWTGRGALLALGALAAILLATYLPTPGAPRGATAAALARTRWSSPCAASAGLAVLLAAAPLGSFPTIFGSVSLAAVTLGFGLVQRLLALLPGSGCPR